MDEKGKEQETMRQVLEMLETELAGRRVFRYMEGEEIREIYGEQFFRNIRKGVRKTGVGEGKWVCSARKFCYLCFRTIGFSEP